MILYQKVCFCNEGNKSKKYTKELTLNGKVFHMKDFPHEVFSNENIIIGAGEVAQQ